MNSALKLSCNIPGYGNIFPHTPLGKITTIVYAIIGMPLFLLYLSNIGDIMARSFKWIYANCCLCRWCPGVAKRRAERRIRRAQQLNVDYESEAESGESSGQVIITLKRVFITFHSSAHLIVKEILNTIVLIKL